MKRSSMQSKIPPAIREELAADPFMTRCIISNELCDGRIEWNHAWTWAGKRQNEIWSILPMCHYHHYHEAAYRRIIQKNLINRIYHFGKEDEFHAKYPKSSLLQ